MSAMACKNSLQNVSCNTSEQHKDSTQFPIKYPTMHTYKIPNTLGDWIPLVLISHRQGLGGLTAHESVTIDNAKIFKKSWRVDSQFNGWEKYNKYHLPEKETSSHRDSIVEKMMNVCKLIPNSVSFSDSA